MDEHVFVIVSEASEVLGREFHALKGANIKRENMI